MRKFIIAGLLFALFNPIYFFAQSLENTSKELYTTVLKVKNLSTKRDVLSVERILSQIPGVVKSQTNLAKGFCELTVTGELYQDILLQKIGARGYEAEIVSMKRISDLPNNNMDVDCSNKNAVASNSNTWIGFEKKEEHKTSELNKIGKRSFFNKNWENNSFREFTPEDEILEKRTRVAKHFKKSDGSFAAFIGDLKHYKDDNGAWQDVDFSIRNNSTGKYSNHPYSNNTHEIKSYFPANADDSGVILNYGNNHLNFWKNPKMKILDSENNTIDVVAANDVKGVITENVIRYNDFPGITDEFVVRDGGVENNIVINSLQGMLNLSHGNSSVVFEQFIPLSDNYKVYQKNEVINKDFSDNSFMIKLPDDSVGFIFSPIVVFDNGITKERAIELLAIPVEKITLDEIAERDAHIVTGKYQIHFVQNGVILSCVVPLNWLQADSRLFPVVIDPYVIVGTGTSVQRSPWGMYWGYERYPSLYTYAEIGTYGTITGTFWYPTVATTVSASGNCYLKTQSGSTLTADTWANIISGATSKAVTVSFPSIDGWYGYTGWTYNYSSGNLLVLCETNAGGTGTGTSSAPQFRYSSATNMSGTLMADNTAPTGNFTLSSNRPNIYLEYTTTSTPANDEPCNATAVTVGSSCSFSTYTNANATASSGPPAPGCASYVGADVWFSVTVPASGHLVFDTQTGVITDGGMAIYSGTCGSLTLIECDDDDSDNGAMSKIDRTGLTSGATIWIRVWEYGGDNNGTFGLCVYSPSAITNDQCADAILLACGSSVAGTTTGATITNDPTADCGTTITAPGVWYRIVGTGDETTVSLCGAPYDSKLSIYSGSCGSLTCITGEDDDYTDCGDNDPYLTFNTVNGTTYYFFVHGYSSGTGDFTINVSCATLLPPNCPTLTSPSNGLTNVSSFAALNWTAPTGGGNPSHYLLYFGTNNPPTNIHNGTNIGNILAYSPVMSPSTTYYWKVVSVNTAGQATGCDTWSFTTGASSTLIVDNTTYTPTQLIQNYLISGCLEAANVTFSGDLDQIGFFTGGNSSIGYNTGLVLSSGNAKDAEGPNSSSSVYTAYSGAGDATIDAIVSPETSEDAAVLEFDFKPSSDIVSFRYTFASEEYNEFVNSSFNDAFGFFLSGGPEGYSSENLALIPGTSVPVTINNVNNGEDNPAVGPCTNCTYFRDNAYGFSTLNIESDGLTTVLTATASVTACQWYHIKLVVADVGDDWYDSWVFLEANSFSSGNGIALNIANATGVKHSWEGCNSNVIFTRMDSSNTSTPITINYTLGGTATSGVDYNNLSNPVTIAAGDTSIVLPLTTISDGLTESVETITFTVNGGGCPCNPIILRDTIYVHDFQGVSGYINESNSTICQGQSVTLTSTVTYGNYYTYDWYAGGTLFSHAANVTVSPTSTTSYTLAIRDSCGNIDNNNTVSISVNTPSTAPTSITASATTVCAGTNVTLTRSGGTLGTGATWQWYSASCGGTSVGTGNSISVAPTTTTTYYVRAEGACGSTTCASVTITVNPVPVLTTSPTSQTICSGGATNIGLSSNVSGTTYSYTVSQSANVSGGASGTTSPIAQTLTYSGTTSGTATYTITPTANSCVGTAQNVVVTVNPKPTITPSPASQIICNGGSTSISLSSNVAGTSISWTASQSGVSGASAGTGTSIAQTLSNSGTTAGTATYTISGTANSCTGSTVNVVVTVNPTPVVTANPVNQTICSGAAPSIALTSNVTGTTYSWTVAQSGVSGGSSGSGTPIAQTLTCSGASQGTATYAVTPSANSCSGNSVNVPIYVNPKPVVTATPSPTSICSGSTTGIALTSNVSGTTFNWTVSQTNATGGSAGSGSSIAQTLSTTGGTPGTVTYAVTGTAVSCTGNATNVNVTVNTIPVITGATKVDVTICGGSNGSITITATGAAPLSFSIDGGSTWTAGTSPYTFSGLTAGNYPIAVKNNYGCITYGATLVVAAGGAPPAPVAGTNATYCQGVTASNLTATAGSGGTIKWYSDPSLTTQIGTNSLFNPNPYLSVGTNNFYITETVSGCQSSATTVTITVNPLPVLTANPTSQTICSGTATNIALSSSVTGTTYSYTVSQASGISGGASGTTSPIAQTLTNANTTSGIATYTIIPTANSCAGSSVNVVVTVNPKPVVTANPTSQTICSGATTSIALSSGVTGTTFAWTVAQSGVSGASNGSGSPIAQTLSNSSTTAGTATYTITPTASTCAGNSINVVVTVNPKPTVTATPASQIICSGNAAGIALTSNVIGTTYAWTVSQSGVTGASSGSGTPIAQTLTTTAAATGTATYTITPTANLCSGTAINVAVTVNPIPNTTATPSSQSVCSGGSTSIALTSNVTGTNFSWTVSQTNASGATAGSGVSIVQSLTATTAMPGTVTYAITPSANSCSGTTTNVVVTVNPIPNVTANPTSQIICSGASTNIALTSNVSGASFSWIVSSSAGITGASNSSGTTISQVLSNSNATSGTATYQITPSANSCSGSSINVVVTVNPTPNVTASPASQTICSEASTNISLSSNVSGVTYNWTVAQGAGITGGSASSGSTIAQALSNSNATAGTATYSVTPSANSCNGTPVNVVVTVSPTPVATANPASSTICSGDVTNITLTSTVTGTSFNWTVSAPFISGASAGSGASIAQTLTSSSTSNATATYTITPTASSCQGTPIVATVTVKPKPDAVANPAAPTICSGISPNIALTSGVSGTSFSWTVSQTGVTGAIAGSGNLINQNLSASGTTAGTATYTVTPTASSCVGTSINIVVTVNPLPVATATPSSQTFCSGGTTSIALSSNVSGTSYSWSVVQSSVTGAAGGSGSSIAQTLTNSGATSGTATYTITPVASGCAGTAIVVVVTVKPIPSALASPSPTTICSGSSTNISLTSAVSGTTFTWTVTPSSGNVSGQAAGSGTSIAQTLTNAGTSVENILYQVTPSASSCTGSTIDVTAYVNPVPVVTPTPASQTLCSGNATGISLSSNVTGSTFNWTVSQSNVSGASAGSGNSIVQVLTATGTSPGTATYTITPTYSGCNGTPVNVVVTVNPNPVATAIPTAQTICSNQSTSLNFTSNVIGTTFSWTVSQSGVSGASSGTGNNISQTLVNSGTTAGTATYTITPSANSCSGNSISVIVTVNPIPVAVATPVSQTICSGTASSIALTSGVAGTSFNWTVSQTGVSGGSNSSGVSIAQTLTSTGSVQGTATYTITPTANLCSGSAIIVPVSVNPSPVVTATPMPVSVCSGSATSISLTSNVTGTTFNWTVSQSGATGGSASSGSLIAQVLTETGGTPGTVTYTITGTASLCSGSPLVLPVTVNTVPVITSAIKTDVTLCGGSDGTISINATGYGPLSYSINGGTTFVPNTSAFSGLPEGNYAVAVSNGYGCVTNGPILVIGAGGAPPAPVAGTNATYCQGVTAANLTATIGSGGTIIWYSNPSLTIQVGSSTTFNPNPYLSVGTNNFYVTESLAGCQSNATTVTITVNPLPVLTATPSSQTICSGQTINIALTSSVTGTTFNWTITQSSGITGGSASNGSTIAQTLTNANATAGTAEYLIIPTASGCSSPATIVIVTVNPKPVVVANPAFQTICSGQTTSIALSSAVSGASFAWTVVQAGVSGASASSGATIAQTITNSGTTQGSATYTITPTANSCVGNTLNAVVTINPLPTVTATPASQTICSGTSTSISLTSNVTGTTFPWTVVQTGVTGALDGAGSSISQVLSNAGTTSGTATYTITPSANSCNGSPVNVLVTVNPLPVLTASPFLQAICDGGSTSIALSSTVTGTAFSWTVVQSGVSGAASGTGSSISQALNTTGLFTGTATYTITPSANSCNGSSSNVIVTVNPIPNVTATPALQTICSGATTNISLSSNVTGASFSWTVSNSAGISGSSNGSGSAITQILTNSGFSSGTSTYNVTPSYNTCSGTPLNVVVTVNPSPNITATPTADTICSGGATNITLSSGVSGTTYSWTISQTAGITGATAGNGGAITQTLSNSGVTNGTATYTITPSANSCNGTPISVVVLVKPRPVASANPSSQAICSGGTTSINLSSTVAGSTFSWTVSSSSISGASAGSGATIAQTLTNTSNNNANATYTITPSANGCSGNSLGVIVTVAPVSTVLASPSSPTICSGNSPNITLSSNVSGASFSWTVTETNVSGASAGSGNSINQVLSATTSSSGTAVYSVTPSYNSCPGTSSSIVVTVNPIPTITATPATQAICSGTAPSVALTSNVSGTTFSWTVVQSGVTGAFNGSGINIGQTLTNTGVVAGTATYTVTPSATGCSGSPVIVVITVNPIPTTTAIPSPTTICSGSATDIQLSSTVSGTNYAWTVSNLSGNISGASASSGSVIAQTLTNSSNVVEYVTYQIIPSATLCSGIPVDVIAYVNPVVVLTATPSSQSICSGASSNINLTSNVTGTTYSWTVSAPGVTGATGGSGNTIVQTLYNSGSSPAIATYTIIPSANSCSGASVAVPVTVNPIPTVTVNPTAQTICSNQATNISLTSNVAGTTFSWTVTQSGATGASDDAGATIAQTLTTTGVVNGMVVYTITPSANICSGSTQNVTVTVKPVPVVTATPNAETICSNQSTNIILTSTVSGTTYSWTTSSSNVTGNTSGTGSSITQTLVNAGLIPGTANYVVTPAANGCMGSDITAVVTVNPIPVISSVTHDDVTLCGGSDGAITITATGGAPIEYSINNGTDFYQNGGSFTGLENGNYQVVVTDFYGCEILGTNVSVVDGGAPVAPVAGTNAVYCEGESFIDLTATAGDGGDLNWYYDPALTINIGSGSVLSPYNAVGTTNYYVTESVGGCESPSTMVTVTIHQLPVGYATPASQSFCNGETTSIVLGSSVSGTAYSWVCTSSSSDVTGYSNDAAGTINQILLTIATTPEIVTYHVIPVANSCKGDTFEVVVTVNPIPVAGFVIAEDTICSNSQTDITLTSNVSNTTFTWTVVSSGISGANGGNGNSINQTLVNSGILYGSATYTITPSANSCSGIPVDAVITINPVPDVSAMPSSQIICSNDTTGIVLSSSVAGTTYTWTASSASGFISGYSDSSNDTISQTLVNSGTTQGMVNYIITPVHNLCPGSDLTISVVVKPSPAVTATPASQTICSDYSTFISLSSSVSGTSYNWTAVPSTVNITGYSNGTGNNISQVLSTTEPNIVTVNYEVVGTASGCKSDTLDVLVSISPLPDVVATPSYDTICSGDVTSIALSSTAPGVNYSWTVTAIGITGASASSGSAIAQTLVNSGSLIRTAIYTITPDLGSCVGSSINVPITVVPLPGVSVTPLTQTICSGDQNAIAITSGVPGAIFNWAVSQTDVTGGVDGSGNTITQTLTSTAQTSGTAEYAITASSNGCNGTPVISTVIVNPLPDVIATLSADTICSGETTAIALSSGVINTNYSWTVSAPGITGALNGSGSNITQTLNNAGSSPVDAVYSIIPTSQGCQGAVQTVSVNVNPIINADAGVDQSIIYGTTATLDATASVGVNLEYSWQPLDSLASGMNTSTPVTINLTGTTLFTLTLTDTLSGCTSADEVLVTVSGIPLSITGVTPDDTICVGQSSILNVTVTGSTGIYDYSWSSIPAGFTAITQSVTVQPTVTTVYHVTITSGIFTTDTSIVVNVNPLPSVILDSFNPVCQGTSAFNLIGGIPTGGIYSGTGVSLGSFNPVVAGVGTHDIIYVYTDNNGCTSSDTSSIEVNQLPTVSLGSFDPVCTDAAPFVLSGGLPAGGIYSGLGVNSGEYYPSAVGSGSHNITYTYTDGNNCTNAATNMIVVNPLPVATITDSTNITCYGFNNGTATVTGSNGILPYSYLWDNDSITTATVGQLEPGVWYHVTLTDANNCSGLDSIILTEPTQMSVSVTSLDPTCNMSNGSITVNPQGGTPGYTYSWSNYPAETGNVLDSIPSGVYTVTVNDANACIWNATVTLTTSPNPAGTIVVENVSCYGISDGSATITMTSGTSPFTYLWSNGNTTNIADSLIFGEYSVIVADANGCAIYDTINITQPEEILLSLVTTNVSCFGTPTGTITAQPTGGTSPFTYLWSTGSTSVMVTGIAGEYCVTATDANNCPVSGCDTIFQPGSVLTAALTVDSAICWGGNTGAAQVVASGGSGSYSYIWNSDPIQTTASVTGLTAGSYCVTVTDQSLCHIVLCDSVKQPTGIFIADTLIYNVSCEEGDDGKAIITASGGVPPYRYRWYINNEAADTLPYINGLETGTYELKITDSKGCFQLFTIDMPNTLIPCLEIPTVFTPNADGVHDKWNIKNLHLYPKATIEVYNRWGSLIFSGETTDESWDGKFNGNDVPNGSYIYIINLNNGTEVMQGAVTIVR